MPEELFTSVTSPVPDELWKDAKSPVQRQVAAVEYWDEMNGRKTASAREERKERRKKWLRRVHTGATLGAAAAPVAFLGAATLHAKAKGYRNEPLILLPAMGTVAPGMATGAILGSLYHGKKEASAMPTQGARAIEFLRNNIEATGAGALGTAMAAKSIYDTGGSNPSGRSRGEVALLADIAKRNKMRELGGGTPGIRDRLLAKRLELAEYDRQNRGKAALRELGIGAASGALVGHGSKHLDKLGPLAGFYKKQ